MPTSKIIILCFILIASCSKIFAQEDTKTYTLKSMNGIDRKVHFMPDYLNGIFKISCLKDTITYHDFYGVPVKIVRLNKYFLELTYAVRGGSGLGLGNVMILCVIGNKLHEAFHVLSYLNGEGGGEQDTYKLKMFLVGGNKRTYKLNVSIHDKVWSKYDPSMNYNYNNKTVLSFDIRENIFYSIKQGIYNSYKVYDSKSDKIQTRKIKGIYPEAILGKDMYCFLEDGWYNVSQDNRLSKYSFNHH